MKSVLKVLTCPNCGCQLKNSGTFLSCDNNHCFDIAKEGYANLLLSNMKRSKSPGDNKTMIDARRMFLGKGYYQPLRTLLESVVNLHSSGIVLDAGCGTGYYTQNLDANKYEILGVDISKYAIQTASKTNKNKSYVVASIFSLPIASNSVDIILNVFAPKPQNEFIRVLKDEGIVVEVVPGKQHLKELKTMIYKDDFLENKEKYALSKFALLNSQKLTYEKQVNSKVDVINLLKMTPYWYKGGENHIRQIECSQFCGITFDFIINIWRKQDIKMC